MSDAASGVCDECGRGVEAFVCVADGCGREFDSFKSLRVHEASHQTRQCSWCGEPFSVRGLDRHEAWCERQPKSGMALVLPVGAWTGRLRDFLEHAVEVPEGCLLVMGDNVGPMFMRREAAAVAVCNASSSLVAIPAPMLVGLRDDAPPRRLRRQGRRVVDDDEAPAPRKKDHGLWLDLDV